MLEFSLRPPCAACASLNLRGHDQPCAEQLATCFLLTMPTVPSAFFRRALRRVACAHFRIGSGMTIHATSSHSCHMSSLRGHISRVYSSSRRPLRNGLVRASLRADVGHCTRSVAWRGALLLASVTPLPLRPPRFRHASQVENRTVDPRRADATCTGYSSEGIGIDASTIVGASM